MIGRFQLKEFDPKHGRNEKAEDVIIEKVGSDETLTAHGYTRPCGGEPIAPGSVTEKVLRGSTHPLVLIRANEKAKSEEEAALTSVIDPLDESELAESVLPTVVELAKA
jgi:hypothetical protein